MIILLEDLKEKKLYQLCNRIRRYLNKNDLPLTQENIHQGFHDLELEHHLPDDDDIHRIYSHLIRRGLK